MPISSLKKIKNIIGLFHFFAVVSVRENLPNDKEFNNAETSSAVDGKGVYISFNTKIMGMQIIYTNVTNTYIPV